MIVVSSEGSHARRIAFGCDCRGSSCINSLIDLIVRLELGQLKRLLPTWFSAKKCKIPPTAPAKIQHVINECQDEIKLAIISEALQVLQENVHPTKNRAKRETFSNDERRIAGCLLQCVYRKMDAINEYGFPTVEGLMSIYTEGVTDKDYNIATAQAVYKCLQDAQKKYITTPQSLEEDGKTCDIAYDVFDCVSERIGEYCGQTP